MFYHWLGADTHDIETAQRIARFEHDSCEHKCQSLADQARALLDEYLEYMCPAQSRALCNDQPDSNGSPLRSLGERMGLECDGFRTVYGLK